MADIKEILKIAGQNLRTAQNSMFSRKYEEASSLAQKIQQSLENVQVEDPDNFQLKTYMNQLEKLKKDLGSKMQKSTNVQLEPAKPVMTSDKKSDPASFLQNASQNIRKAQNSMFSRRYDEAFSFAREADRALNQAQKHDPDNVQLKSISNQLAKLRNDLDAKTKTKPKQENNPSDTSASQSRLPAGVVKRIRDIKDYLEGKNLVYASQSLKEIINGYSGKFDENDPEFQEALNGVKALEAELQENAERHEEEKEEKERQRAERNEQSQEWIDKIKSLKPFSYNTEDIDSILEQEQAYTAASELFDNLSRTVFPSGKTEILESLEAELKKNLSGFTDIINSCRRTLIDKVKQNILNRLESLDKTFEGKIYIISEGSIKECEQWIEELMPLSERQKDDIQGLKNLFEELKIKNSKNKEIRKKQIFLKDHQYNGPDLDDIRSRAVKFVTDAVPGAEIIKVIVQPEAWKEIKRWEQYELSQRFVTRREIYSQIACKIIKDYKLYAIYITQELNSDGSWSQLTGNVMYIEDMAKENI